ncbi:response regulator [Neptunitalea chrysea]|uniref:Response regulator n=1 Tax=Neptunitalea chrysea TaxID=1647581 RepID=A0A9W6B5I8_9FLAO|nr:response regulator [Neptunitalea chrysea]GLB52989.1 response regulator [Neptunitalea chrysea]
MKGSELNICVVEDSTLTLLLLQKMVEIFKVPIRVNTFTQGSRALEWIKNTVKDKEELGAILVDLNMPEMSGWEFVAALEEENPNIEVPVYIVSASCDPIDKERIEEYPTIKGFLHKPLKVEDLERITDTKRQSSSC